MNQDEHTAENAPLQCAWCDGEELHHSKVSVFQREEDEPTGLHVKVADGNVTVDTDITENPSLRREGVTMEFWCETCPGQTLLHITQHKGRTYYWIEMKDDRGE